MSNTHFADRRRSIRVAAFLPGLAAGRRLDVTIGHPTRGGW